LIPIEINDECCLYSCLLKCDSLLAKCDETVYFGHQVERLYDSLVVKCDSSPVKCDVSPVKDNETVYFRRKTVYFGYSFERLHLSLAVKCDSLPVMCDATPVKHNETVYFGRPSKRKYDPSLVKPDAS